jgi:hypothetical protein
MGIQPAVNQANIWHNRARQYTPSNIHGELNRSMLGIQSMVKGTGAGLHAAQLIAHTPIIDAMGGYVNQRRASQRRPHPSGAGAPGHRHQPGGSGSRHHGADR